LPSGLNSAVLVAEAAHGGVIWTRMAVSHTVRLCPRGRDHDGVPSGVEAGHRAAADDVVDVLPRDRVVHSNPPSLCVITARRPSGLSSAESIRVPKSAPTRRRRSPRPRRGRRARAVPRGGRALAEREPRGCCPRSSAGSATPFRWVRRSPIGVEPLDVPQLHAAVRATPPMRCRRGSGQPLTLGPARQGRLQPCSRWRCPSPGSRCRPRDGRTVRRDG